MPAWVIVLMCMAGIAGYFGIFLAVGSWSDEVLQGHPGYDDDFEMASFWIGIFWPIAGPLFTVWYLVRLKSIKEG